jgi:hypothetical protein
VRVRQIGPALQQLLQDVSGQISTRLESTFQDPSDLDGPNVGVALRERGSAVSIEIPFELFARASADPAAREALRVRLKGRRDRMLFRIPPTPLPRNVAPAPFSSAGPAQGFRAPWRGRR